ncbi:hypothetical protein CRENBAI_013808 [Crenichthys baileyi]|uniref:Uncharacterized protein n=1 Tax=Crenichthys baileyi TaxID=28760 RepID=A0AAV9SIN3_9TELE
MCLAIKPPPITTVQPNQQKDQAVGEAIMTLFEYLSQQPKKSLRLAEEEKQQSPLWGSRPAIPLLGTGPRRLDNSSQSRASFWWRGRQRKQPCYQLLTPRTPSAGVGQALRRHALSPPHVT